MEPTHRLRKKNQIRRENEKRTGIWNIGLGIALSIGVIPPKDGVFHYIKDVKQNVKTLAHHV